MEFTKEQLIEQAKKNIEVLRGAAERIPGASDAAVIHLKLDEIALASLEAEPVAFRSKLKSPAAIGSEHWDYTDHRQPDAFELENCIIERLYTAPPAPVSVPDEITFEKIAEITASQGYEYSINECICAASWWNACRAAMLQGAENAEAPTTMQTAPVMDTSTKIADSTSDNSPVIPGCSCRNCLPVTTTDMRFVVFPECGNKRCPHANDHRNACTGSNEPGQEGSAHPAAPQQEA